jgi:hypothetical protein
MHHIENDTANNSSVVVCVLIAGEICSPSCCLARGYTDTAGYSHKPTLKKNEENRQKNIWTCLHVHNNTIVEVTCLPLLPSNDSLLCLLGVAVSVPSSIN